MSRESIFSPHYRQQVIEQVTSFLEHFNQEINEVVFIHNVSHNEIDTTWTVILGLSALKYAHRLNELLQYSAGSLYPLLIGTCVRLQRQSGLNNGIAPTGLAVVLVIPARRPRGPSYSYVRLKIWLMMLVVLVGMAVFIAGFSILLNSPRETLQ